jgi:uncharacterized membrane protein
VSLLIAGVAVWIIVHLMPALAPTFRQSMIDTIGSKPYRGVFAVVILGSLAMIIVGWRSTPEAGLYRLPEWARTIAFVLMFGSFILFGAANYRTAIRRVIRHPMLTGVVLWSISHLLTNGTTRALVLFGGLGIWAILEIFLINRRDPEDTRPTAPGFSGEIKGAIISGILFGVVLYLHPYFTGVTLLSR